MTDKELRKLKRRDLLEILYDQAEEIERLEAENKELKQRLDDRRILVEKTGTMAEAALALNAVFEAADAAAKQYLENIRAGCREEGEDGFAKETPSEKVEKDSKKPISPGKSETGQAEETPEIVPWIEE